MDVRMGAKWCGSAFAVTTVLVWAHLASAACTSSRCSDGQAMETMRSQLAVACNCTGTASPKRYLKCAKSHIKTAVRDGHLPASCKKAVLRCEAATTCGKPEAVACCKMSGRGKVKARIVKNAAACRGGTACPGIRSARDACGDDGQCAGIAGTFRSVQTVFTQSCALPSCHSSFARQGSLILDTEDVSHQSLVDRPSFHTDAKQAGLLRVTPGDPENSFLIRKLRGLGPGDSMPQGAPVLPDSVITMIEDWVERGAHTTVEECPAAATGDSCDGGPINTGTFVWQPEPALEVPAPNEGVQLYIPRRDVEPGTEWETCYAFRPDWRAFAAAQGLPAGTQPVVKRQEYRMHSGSHHLLLYAYFGAYPEQWAEGFFPCFAANCANPGDCPIDSGALTLPIGGTQVAGTRYVVDYPPGVGLPIFNPNVVLIANLHYTNPFQPQQPIYGEGWLNLYFAQPGEFRVLLDGIFAINYQGTFIEPYETRTFSRVWQPQSILTRAPVDAAVFQLFGHMHKRGEVFQIDYVSGGRCSGSTPEQPKACGRDDDCACQPWQRSCQSGQTCLRSADAQDATLYYTTHWDNAPVVDFPKPYLYVNKEQGLRWTCTHTNGVPGDPTRPPKRCHEGCNSCGWTGGRCSTNGNLCRVGDVCETDQTCEADTSGLASSGFRCRNANGRFTDTACCPGVCTESADARTCWFTRGLELGYHSGVRTYQEGDPIPVVFGELADDDMCNMFGYMIPQSTVPLLP